MDTSQRYRSFARGFTLVELMVALAIGLLMAFGLVRVFASSSDSYRALAQASQQIENGRYAMQMISQDLHHAGYYGEYGFCHAPATLVSDVCVIPAATVLPDPCEIADPAKLKTAIPFHVQGYNKVNGAGGDAPPACINNANVVAGTDILVIRRATTVKVPGEAPGVLPAPLLANEVYMQANADSTNLSNPVISFGSTPGNFTLLKKDAATPAEIRKYHVIIYFVAPCGEPVGGPGALCTAAADGGRPVPTLKRLMLGVDAAGTRLMRTEAIAEGIENLQIDYGVDTFGSGFPVNFVAAPADAAAWGNVMAAQVRVLARSVDRNPGWDDTKTYDLGIAGTFGPGDAGFDPTFKRHLFTSQVRLVNPAGRRETP